MFFNHSHPNSQKYIHEKLKHTVIKYLAKNLKSKKSHFQTITTNNSKRVSDFILNNTDTFMELLTNNITPYSTSNTDIFTEFLPNYTKNFFKSTNF